MPTDHAEATQLIASFSDAIRAGQIRLADRQLGCLSDILVQAIADDELPIQRLLKAALSEAFILFPQRTSPTPGTSIAPGDARMLGIIETLGGMANTAVRNHRMRDLSSTGADALALAVLQATGRSRDPLSDHDIARALEVYAEDLRPTLSYLQEAGLVRVTPSSVSSQYAVTRRGLDALRNGSVTVEVTAADTLGQDDKPSSGMRR